MASRKLIYLASPSYSGSTLATILIASHPRIATVGELKASAFGDIEEYRCSCGSLMLDCDYWRELEVRVNRRLNGEPPFSLRAWNTHFSGEDGLLGKALGTQLRGPLFERLRDFLIAASGELRRNLNAKVTLNRALIEAVCEIQGADYFLDGSKDPIRARHFARSGEFEIYLLTLVRDGRGTAYSSMKNDAMDMTEAAGTWLNKIVEIEQLKRYVPVDRQHTVRYEDLCNDTEATLGRTYDFLGLERIDEKTAEELLHERGHIFGNRMRLKELDHINLDETWRTHLSAQDLSEFERIAGACNRRYGYR